MKKKLSFGKGLLVYAAAFLVLIIIGSVIFWNYLSSYEKSRPDLAVEAFLETTDDAYWENILMEGTASIASSSYENTEDVMKNIFDALRGNAASYRKRNTEYSPETPVYTIRIAGHDFARLSLKADGSAGFGFNNWAIEKVELLNEFIPSYRMIQITVPAGASCSVNGTPVSKDQLTETVIYEGLSDFETGFTNPVSMDVYQIDCVYDNVEVTASMPDGTILSADASDGTTFYFDQPLSTRTITIHALDTLRVVLNGAIVPTSFITASEPLPLLGEVESFLGSTPMPQVVTYTIPDIYDPEEVVYAIDNAGDEVTAMVDSTGAWSLNWGGSNMPSDRQTNLENVMWAYIRFSANYNLQISYNWSILYPYLLNGTDLYYRMTQMLEGLIWQSASKAELNNCEILSYSEFGQDCFIVRAVMDYTIVRPSGEETDQPVFDFVFVRYPGTAWQLAAMDAV